MANIIDNAAGLDLLSRAELALFASTYTPQNPYYNASFWDAINIIRQADLRVRASIFREINGNDVARWVNDGVL